MSAPASHVPDRPRTRREPSPAERPGRLRALVTRSPLVGFLILSCLLSWWPWALQAVHLQVPGPPVTGVGPFLAAVVVLGVTQGSTGVRRLLRSMTHWRVPGRAYLAGIGLPVLASGTAVLLTLASGAARPVDADLAVWTSIPVVLLLVLVVPGTGGAWEEPGWRGYALGRFEQRFGLLAGPLVLGAFWAFWHAPLFATGDILWPDLLVVVAASVVAAAVFHSARDSVLIAMVFHATNNAVGGSYASQLFHGDDSVTLGLMTAGAWWVVAIAVLVKNRRRYGSRHHALRPGGAS